MKTKYKQHFICFECDETFHSIPIVTEHGKFCSDECISMNFIRRLQEQEMNQVHPKQNHKHE